jgi:hypothetical protein
MVNKQWTRVASAHLTHVASAHLTPDQSPLRSTWGNASAAEMTVLLA